MNNKRIMLTKGIFYGLVLFIILLIALINKDSIYESIKYNFLESDNISMLFEGLGNTIIITICAFLIGLIIGFITCLVEGLSDKNPFYIVLKQIFKLYVNIFRGTPAVVQLLIIYFIIFRTVSADYSIAIAILAFGLNSGAYVSEILRGGINSVPQGQIEAGRSLGLSYPTVMIKIVFPQAIRNALPSLGNEFITLIKETSIVGFIGAYDLTLAFRKLANATYDYAAVYIVMGITYFIIILGITSLFNLLERKLIKHVNTK